MLEKRRIESNGGEKNTKGDFVFEYAKDLAKSYRNLPPKLSQSIVQAIKMTTRGLPEKEINEYLNRSFDKYKDNYTLRFSRDDIETLSWDIYNGVHREPRKFGVKEIISYPKETRKLIGDYAASYFNIETESAHEEIDESEKENRAQKEWLKAFAEDPLLFAEILIEKELKEIGIETINKIALGKELAKTDFKKLEEKRKEQKTEEGKQNIEKIIERAGKIATYIGILERRDNEKGHSWDESVPKTGEGIYFNGEKWRIERSGDRLVELIQDDGDSCFITLKEYSEIKEGGNNNEKENNGLTTDNISFEKITKKRKNESGGTLKDKKGADKPQRGKVELITEKDTTNPIDDILEDDKNSFKEKPEFDTLKDMEAKEGIDISEDKLDKLEKSILEAKNKLPKKYQGIGDLSDIEEALKNRRMKPETRQTLESLYSLLEEKEMEEIDSGMEKFREQKEGKEVKNFTHPKISEKVWTWAKDNYEKELSQKTITEINKELAYDIGRIERGEIKNQEMVEKGMENLLNMTAGDIAFDLKKSRVLSDFSSENIDRFIKNKNNNVNEKIGALKLLILRGRVNQINKFQEIIYGEKSLSEEFKVGQIIKIGESEFNIVKIHGNVGTEVFGIKNQKGEITYLHRIELLRELYPRVFEDKIKRQENTLPGPLTEKETPVRESFIKFSRENNWEPTLENQADEVLEEELRIFLKKLEEDSKGKTNHESKMQQETVSFLLEEIANEFGQTLKGYSKNGDFLETDKDTLIEIIDSKESPDDMKSGAMVLLKLREMIYEDARTKEAIKETPLFNKELEKGMSFSGLDGENWKITEIQGKKDNEIIEISNEKGQKQYVLRSKYLELAYPVEFNELMPDLIGPKLPELKDSGEPTSPEPVVIVVDQLETQVESTNKKVEELVTKYKKVMSDPSATNGMKDELLAQIVEISNEYQTILKELEARKEKRKETLINFARTELKTKAESLYGNLAKSYVEVSAYIEDFIEKNKNFVNDEETKDKIEETLSGISKEIKNELQKKRGEIEDGETTVSSVTLVTENAGPLWEKMYSSGISRLEMILRDSGQDVEIESQGSGILVIKKREESNTKDDTQEKMERKKGELEKIPLYKKYLENLTRNASTKPIVYGARLRELQTNPISFFEKLLNRRNPENQFELSDEDYKDIEEALNSIRAIETKYK